jgi:2-octaprenyl-6-methoxyphenol hydroxylase
MDKMRDILIVGGGLNGTALALACAQAGLTVTLVEPNAAAMGASERFDGRSYALALASARLLMTLGLWPALKPHAQPIEGIRVADGRPGEAPSPLSLTFDAAEVEDRPMGYMVEDRHLRPALLSAVAAEPHILSVSGRVAAQSADDREAQVRLTDGQALNARVIVGADGRGSGTALRAGIRHIGWTYSQTALVCALDHDMPHGGIARQVFLPAGPLAVLPLTGNRASIVWSEATATAQAMQALDDDAYLAVLRPRVGDVLGDIRLAGDRWTYPLALSFAHSFIAPRVALVGDAAHGVHPIAGQGLNAGLKDVAALAEVLALAARRGEDIGRAEVLARYQTWRRFDAATLAVATDGFNRLFSNDNPVLRAVRDAGLAAVNALPALRRGFLREAAGLTGDLPRLLAGRPI